MQKMKRKLFWGLAVVAGLQLAEARPEAPKEKERIFNEARNFECLVVGGGMGGICLAKTAGFYRVGVQVMGDRPVFGGRNSSEGREGVGARTLWLDYPNLGRILAKVAPVRDAEPDEDGAFFEDERKRISLLGIYSLGNPVCAVEFDEQNPRRLAAVIVRNLESGQLRRWRAQLFVDATQEGDLVALANAAGGIERGSADALPFGAFVSRKVENLVFTGRTVDAPAEFWAKHGSVHDEAIAGEVAGMLIASAKQKSLPIQAAATNAAVVAETKAKMGRGVPKQGDYHAYPPQICEWYHFKDLPPVRLYGRVTTNLTSELVEAIEQIGQSHWNAHPELKNEVIPLPDAVKKAEGLE